MTDFAEIKVCTDAVLSQLTDVAGEPAGGDFTSQRVFFSNMKCAFVQIIVDGVDANDFTVQLLVSNIKDQNSFAPYDGPRTIDPDCDSFGWNLCDFGFMYAKVVYKKVSVTTGTVRILARAKKG